MSLEILQQSGCFGGIQGIYRHHSIATGTPMRFTVFRPPQAERGPVPVIWCLAGLTCTEENFTVKAGAQRIAAALGLMLVVPDTSPRGDGVPGDPAGSYDFGLGAGFYLDATQPPFATHYRMATYLERELPALIGENFPADMTRQGITGHSMGGHGALTIGLRNPKRFKAVAAFSPIVAPSQCPWGQKALAGYLGTETKDWRRYDACALIADGARLPAIWVDQGMADPFLTSQLKPELLVDACDSAGVALTFNQHIGYDHSYFFIASVIEAQLTWQASRLAA